MKLLVATGNPGKLREFEQALAPQGIEVVSLQGTDFKSVREPEETGTTFEENARIKAEEYSRRTNLPVVADDSGLEVDALDGKPGVQSARYGGPHLDDVGRVGLVLQQVANVEDPHRTARFRAVLAVALAGQTLATFEGVVEGRLLKERRGGGGFGYDPIFFHEEAGCTFAELSVEEKRRRSHRGQAIAKLVRALREGAIPLDPAPR